MKESESKSNICLRFIQIEKVIRNIGILLIGLHQELSQEKFFFCTSNKKVSQPAPLSV